MKITFCSAKFYALLTSSLLLSQLCCLFGSELPAFSEVVEDTEVIQIGADNHSHSHGESTGAVAENEAPALSDAQKSLLQKPSTIVLKPGEKLNITGFAEEKEATIADLKRAATNPEYHRVQMRISGSMCFACLHTFEEKLKQVYGIERVKINRTTPSIQSVSPDLSNWADAVIFYDASLLSMADMRAYIKTNGYFSYRVLDKPADGLPIEEPKPLKK